MSERQQLCLTISEDRLRKKQNAQNIQRAGSLKELSALFLALAIESVAYVVNNHTILVLLLLFVIEVYARNCHNTSWNNRLTFMSIHKILTPVMKG